MLMDTEQTKTKNQNKIYYIIIAIFSVLIIVLGTIDAILVIKNNSSTEPSHSSSDNKSDGSDANNSDTGDGTEKSITDLTKEEAIAALKEMSNPYYTPEGFLDPAMMPQGAKRYFILEYSYETLDDIKEEDYHVSEFNKYPLNITPVDGTYAVVTAVDGDKIIASQPTGIAFDKRYINFYEETTIEEGGSQSTNSRLDILDTSDAFIKKALPILFISLDYFGPSLNSIYDYEYQEEDGSISLITYNIGIGLNMQELDTATADSIPYAINIYTVKCSINKDTGKFSWDRDEQGNKNKIINSFPIDENEMMELATYFSL